MRPVASLTRISPSQNAGPVGISGLDHRLVGQHHLPPLQRVTDHLQHVAVAPADREIERTLQPRRQLCSVVAVMSGHPILLRVVMSVLAPKRLRTGESAGAVLCRDPGPERPAWTDAAPGAGTDPLYVAYHDTEWGVPERDPRALWEKLVLDGFQAGLAWITILRKRDAFRAAFDGFDPDRIAGWGEADVARLLADPGIVRSRAKIEATIGNARAFLAIEAAERLCAVPVGLRRRRADAEPLRRRGEVPAATAESERDVEGAEGGGVSSSAGR